MENWFDVLKELTYVKQNGEDTFVYKNHVLDYPKRRKTPSFSYGDIRCI